MRFVPDYAIMPETLEGTCNGGMPSYRVLVNDGLLRVYRNDQGVLVELLELDDVTARVFGKEGVDAELFETVRRLGVDACLF